MSSVNFREGDLVRVTLEGVVGYMDGQYFEIGRTPEAALVFGEQDYLKSVEVVKPPFKVGDIVADHHDLYELPEGAVVKPTDNSYVAAEKAVTGWFWANGKAEPQDGPPEFPAT